MVKQLSLVGLALAMTAGALVPATPAAAQGRGYGDGYGYNDNSYRDNGYNDGYRTYRDRDDRRYRRSRARDKCRDGDGGTIAGALAGGLAGSQIAGRGDRTLGLLLGAGIGALTGRAIDRSDRPGYCR